MEKYLADRSYALICRMCQVQAFPSRLHAKGFPAIGKYEPKTPPRTAGVTKCVIGFGRCSGFVRHFCRESPTRTARRPVARAFLALGLRKAELDSRMLRSLSPAAFSILSPGARYISGRIQYPGNSSLFFPFSLVFRRVAGIAARQGFPFARIGNRTLRTGRSLRSDAESARNAGSCPVGRPVPELPPRRRHPIPLGWMRQSYVSLCGGHTRPGVAISPSRGLRPQTGFRPRGLRRREETRARNPEASETRKPVRQGIWLRTETACVPCLQ